MLKSVASLMNKVIIILESKLGSDCFDWDIGVKRYTRQKSLLTVNEKICGPPDSDSEEFGSYAAPAKVRKWKASKKSVFKEISSFVCRRALR